MRILETSNFDCDYPDEKFLNLPFLKKEDAEAIVKLINSAVGVNSSRYWKVVENNYKLQPGFEP